MPANEFEKQVQKQLDDFELNPSASVWKKVADQIQKKKRRRVFFFFLFSAALLLLGYYGYHLLQTNKKAEIVQQPVASKNEKLATSDKKNTSEETREKTVTPQSPEPNEPGTSAKKEARQKRTAIDAVNDDLQISSNNHSTGHKKNKPAKKGDDEVTIAQKKPGDLPLTKNNTIKTKQDISVTTDPPAKSSDEKNETTKKPFTEKDIQKDVAVTKDKNIVPVKTDSIKTNDIAATNDKKDVVAKKKNNKFQIKWGIDFSAAITANRNRAFPLLGPTAQSYTLNYIVPPAAGVPGVIIPPSSVKPGAAFRIGITGELHASASSSFSAGLQYSYASNKIMTGVAIDTFLRLQTNNNSSPVDLIYRGSYKNSYTNSYHFISVPLEYHWLVNKGKKLPLQWNVGLSVSYLVATNALVYSPSYGGIYYQANDAINKLHFNIGTGLFFRLTGKNGVEWVLGPEIWIDTRKLVNNKYDAKQYLLFSGINARIFFPKKKK